MFRKQSDARGRQTALIEEMIGNQKIVQAFGYEDKSSGRFALINEELKECSQKAVFYSSLTNPSTRFVNNVIYAGVALCFHDSWRFPNCWWSVRTSCLCKSVHETIQ